MQLLLHGEVGDLTELKQRTLVALDGHHEDGRRIGIGLRHSGRVAVARKEALGTRHLVAHVIGRRFEVYGEFKLYGDVTRALLAHTGERADTGDTVDILLQRLGNLVLYDIGIGTRIGARHRDNGVIHRGIFAHAKAHVTNRTKEHDDERKHGGQHRTADTKF